MIKVERIEYNIELCDFPRLILSLYYKDESIEEAKTFLETCYKCKISEKFDCRGKSINFEYFEDLEVIQEMITNISKKNIAYLLEMESDVISTQIITNHLNQFFLLTSKEEK